MTKRTIGYSFRIDPTPLEKAGAEHVFHDISPRRVQRELMMRGEIGGLRKGDVLMIYSLRNLSGSPKADDHWRKLIEALPATIQIVETTKEPKKLGRRRRYDPPLHMAQEHWDIWMNPVQTEERRLELVALSYGSEVTRNVLNKRYGTRAKPKPRPGDNKEQS